MTARHSNPATPKNIIFRSEYRATLVVMVSLALVTLTGFLRQTVVAYELGAGRVADIYLVAFAIPEFFFIALPIVLTPVIIPLFSQARQQRGAAYAWLWGRRLSTLLFLILLGIALLAWPAAPILIAWLSPGFTVGERAQTLQIFYRMLPSLVFAGASVLVGSVLQVYRKFARPVLTTGVYNLVFIATMLLLPISEPLDRAGWAVTMGAAAMLLFQLPLFGRIRKSERTLTGQLESDTPETTEAFRLIGWMAAGYGVHHLILFIDRAMATSLAAGSVAVLSFGYHIALAIGQLSGLAVATVIFPGLSEKIGSKDLGGARQALSQGMGLVWALALPAFLGLVALRIPLVQVLLEHGAFPAQATLAVAQVMAIYAVAVLADALCQPLWRVVYALRSGPAVLAINTIQTLIRLVCNIIFIRLYGYYGLAISACIGLGFQVILLSYVSRETIDWRISSGGWVFAGKVVAAGGAAFGFALFARQILSAPRLALSSGVILVICGALLTGVYCYLMLVVFKLFRQAKDSESGQRQFDFH